MHKRSVRINHSFAKSFHRDGFWSASVVIAHYLMDGYSLPWSVSIVARRDTTFVVAGRCKIETNGRILCRGPANTISENSRKYKRYGS